MAYIPVNMSGSIGLIRDIREHLLNPAAWTAIKNCRMNNSQIIAFPGHSEVYATPSHDPYNVFYIDDDETQNWVYTGLTDVSVYQDGSHTELTRASGDYSATANRGWTGGWLSGILILDNGVDVPQFWASPSPAQLLQDLTSWPASTTCKVMRPFKYFLVGLDWTESGTRFPYKVRWSGAAIPGSLPGTWDTTDATDLAGQYDLGDTSDALVDCLKLGKVNVVYKEDSAYAMQFVGYPDIFGFDQISGVAGLYAPNCAVEFKPGTHAVLTRDDFIVHDLTPSVSVIDAKTRKWLFNQIDNTNWRKTFLYHNILNNEIWICYPEAGETNCTQALIWNYIEENFGVRDLPEVYDIKNGIITATGNDTWDAGEDTTWAAGLDVSWNYQAGDTKLHAPFFSSPENTKFYNGDLGITFDGVAPLFYCERQGLAITELRQGGGSGTNREDSNYTANVNESKHLRRVFPRILMSSGDTIEIFLGTQTYLNQDVQWDASITFDPNSDTNFVDCDLHGILFAIRFESSTPFEIDGYDLEVSAMGKR